VSRSTFTPSARLTVRFHTETKEFATFLIGNLTDTIEPENTVEFSVVEFATQAFITSGLTDDVAAKAAVNGIAYSGGFTNTEQAILKCNATLNTSTADVKYIALFTDGAPTVFGFTDTGPSSGCNVNGGPVGSDCRNAAVDAAEAAKAAGIQIATILVSTVSATEDFLANEIASPGLNYTADSFADVDKLVKDIIFEVDPCE
jgi:hypothetical protein